MSALRRSGLRREERPGKADAGVTFSFLFFSFVRFIDHINEDVFCNDCNDSRCFSRSRLDAPAVRTVR